MSHTLPATPYDALLTCVRTARERDTAREQCDAFLKLLYTDQKGNLSTLISYSFSEDVGLVLLQIVKENHIDPQHKMNLQTFFIQLREYLLALPVLKLTLAFSPTKQILLRFSDWARKELDTHVVIEYRTDETLIAGTVIEYNGIYRELSLREDIPRSIYANREKLLGLLA